MPTSTEFESPASGFGFGKLEPQIEHGQVTLTVTSVPGASRLPVSSTARVFSVVDGPPCARHVYAQLVVPLVTGCQVVPPSVEISTPATMPPPVSDAVPVIVTALPSATVV